MIGLLTILLIGLLTINWWNSAKRVSVLERTHLSTPFDWATISDRDLDIASVFLTARDIGVEQAMDSLQRMTVADTTLRNDGHMIAHVLGRYAITRNGNDPSAVLASCRPTFQAGCYHGVMEGYLANLPAVDPKALVDMCTALIRPNVGRSVASECAHGVGHGLLERQGYDLHAALAACDAFGNDDLRGECHDGVFMQNSVGEHEMASMAMPDSGPAGHTHAMPHLAAGPPGPNSRDSAFPCDSVGMQYQPSCWAYQPLTMARLAKYDFPQVLRGCAQAPKASASRCYQGFGKQSMGWFGWSHLRVIATCLSAGTHASDCLAGGVEALVDLTLNGDRAAAFCSEAPEHFRSDCFATVGSRVAEIRADTSEIQRDCAAAVKPSYVEACLRGSTLRRVSLSRS
jgi:hypothetical protein